MGAAERELARRIFTLRHLWYVILFLLIVFSAYLIVASSVVAQWAQQGGVYWLLLTIFAGLLYTAFSTTPIAVAIFISLSQAGMPVLATALIGGAGAMLGDTGLLKILKISILDDTIIYLVKKTHGKFERFMHRRIVRGISILIGGLVVASPLPDELGMAIMGMTELPSRYIMLVSFTFNTLSITAVSLLVR